MTKRRSRGDGNLYWDDDRQRWVAKVTVGYTPAGKRIFRKVSCKTKTEAQKKLRDLLRDLEDGLPSEDRLYTVGQAVTDFLKFGLPRRAESTVEKLTTLANCHVIPDLGARKARELTADEVDKWAGQEGKDPVNPHTPRPAFDPSTGNRTGTETGTR